MRARLVIVVSAAFVQLITVLYLGSSVSGGDAQTYLAISSDWRSWSRLLSPEAFEGNFWPAGYSGVLAAFGGEHQVLSVRLLQVFMAAVVALMAGVLTDAVSRRLGTVTVLIVAFSPTMLWGIWAIGYEASLAFLLTAGLLLVWKRWQTAPLTAATLGGFLLGLSLLFQFRAIFAVVVVLVGVALRNRLKAAWAFVGVAFPVLFWSLRSKVATGSWAPWSTNGPYNLWNGNNPEATGRNMFPLPALPSSDDSYSSAAVAWMTQHPMDFLVLAGRKFVFLFQPTHLSEVTDPFLGEQLVVLAETALAVLISSGLVVFVLARLTGRLRELRQLDVPFLFSMSYLLPNIVFIVEPRFSIPVHAILVAIAVPSLALLGQTVFQRRDQQVVRSMSRS